MANERVDLFLDTQSSLIVSYNNVKNKLFTEIILKTNSVNTLMIILINKI